SNFSSFPPDIFGNPAVVVLFSLALPSSRTFQSSLSLLKSTILCEALRIDREAYSGPGFGSDLSTVHPLMPASNQLIQSTSSLEVFIARPTAGTGALRKPNCCEGLPDFGVNRTFRGLGIFQAGPGEVVLALEYSITNDGSAFARIVLKYDECARSADE